MAKRLTATIKLGQTKHFKYVWKPTQPEKHLLTIDVYDGSVSLQHIESRITVGANIQIKDNLAGVRLT